MTVRGQGASDDGEGGQGASDDGKGAGRLR